MQTERIPNPQERKEIVMHKGYMVVMLYDVSGEGQSNEQIKRRVIEALLLLPGVASVDESPQEGDIVVHFVIGNAQQEKPLAKQIIAEYGVREVVIHSD